MPAPPPPRPHGARARCRRLTRTVTAVLGAALLAACGTDGEPEEIPDLEAAFRGLGTVEAVYVRHHTDPARLYVSLQLEDGSDATTAVPVIEASRTLLEHSPYAADDLTLSVDWPHGEDGRRELSASGGVRMLAPLANEARTMEVLGLGDVGTASLRIGDHAVDAQYTRDIDISFDSGLEDRALIRLVRGLRAQLPDGPQETNVSVSADDYADGGDDPRRVSVSHAAPEEYLDLVDDVVRHAEPSGWQGGHDLQVSLRHSYDDEFYVSAALGLSPAGWDDLGEDDLAGRAGEDTVMDPAVRLAEQLAPFPGDLFLDVTLRSQEGRADVAAFDSFSCAGAWEDETGRSRQLWRAWVEAGGRPGEDGATATECPEA